MGAGSPHRKKGKGRGTRQAWTDRMGLEAEPVLPADLSQADKELINKDFKVINLNSRRPDAPAADAMHAGPEVGGKEVKGLEKYPKNVLKEAPEVLLQADGAKKEIKEPKYYFEKKLATAISNTYQIIKQGLELIRLLNSHKKSLGPVDNEKKKQIKNLYLLNNIHKVNPDGENYQTELKKLRDIEQAEIYNFDDLRQKVNSNPDVIALKESGKTEVEKEVEYDDLVKKILSHEVREIFRSYQKADAGRANEIAIMLAIAVDRGLVELVAYKNNEKTENPPIGEKIESAKSLKEQQKEDFVRHIMGDDGRMETIVYSSFGKALINSRVNEIINKLRVDKAEEVIKFIQEQDPEKTDSNPELQILVEQKLGEIIVRDFGDVIPGKQEEPAGTAKKEQNIEEIFSPEQVEKLNLVANVLRKYYLQELEEAKKSWSAGWQGVEGQEMAKLVIQYMKRASARESYDKLVLNFKLPLMHKDAAVDYITEKIFEEK